VKITINLNMTIEEAQKLVDNWIKEKGVRYFNELTNTTILMEEVGELARVISRKYGEQSTKKGEENLDLADELADVMWVLMCIANQTSVDLTDALKKNIEKKDRRDSQRHINNKKLQ
jgi:NTP pyrophosphatase (non-canonical NTP hydrolase)